MYVCICLCLPHLYYSSLQCKVRYSLLESFGYLHVTLEQGKPSKVDGDNFDANILVWKKTLRKQLPFVAKDHRNYSTTLFFGGRGGKDKLPRQKGMKMMYSKHPHIRTNGLRPSG